jgi:hypothetical protein
VASLLNSHEDKIFKLREKFEDKKKTALTDLEKGLLEERKEKYRQAIAAPDVPVKTFPVSFAAIQLGYNTLDSDDIRDHC